MHDCSLGSNIAIEEPDVKLINALQAKLARTALEMELRQVAAETAISVSTILKVEHGTRVSKSTLGNLRRFYENQGIEFLDDERPGVRLVGRKP